MLGTPTASAGIPDGMQYWALRYGKHRAQAGQTFVGTLRHPSRALTIWVHAGGSGTPLSPPCFSRHTPNRGLPSMSAVSHIEPSSYWNRLAGTLSSALLPIRSSGR
jgi:hypothetical protein